MSIPQTKIVKIKSNIKGAYWYINSPEIFEVYVNESDWPKEESNERGMTFDGRGSHYRLVDSERFIRKSHCVDMVIAKEPEIITVCVTGVPSDSKLWYADKAGVYIDVYHSPEDWPDLWQHMAILNPAKWWRVVDTEEYKDCGIKKTDCYIVSTDSLTQTSVPKIDENNPYLSHVLSTPIDKLFDPVNRPAHYAGSKIEVIDFIEDKQLGFHLGNAVKHISRAGKKDPTKYKEDLEKAMWYLKRAISSMPSTD